MSIKKKTVFLKWFFFYLTSLDFDSIRNIRIFQEIMQKIKINMWLCDFFNSPPVNIWGTMLSISLQNGYRTFSVKQNWSVRSFEKILEATTILAISIFLNKLLVWFFWFACLSSSFSFGMPNLFCDLPF